MKRRWSGCFAQSHLKAHLGFGGDLGHREIVPLVVLEGKLIFTHATVDGWVDWLTGGDLRRHCGWSSGSWGRSQKRKLRWRNRVRRPIDPILDLKQSFRDVLGA